MSKLKKPSHSVGDYLGIWMRHHGVSDQDLANAVGVTRPYISRIRRGEVHPNLGVSLKIRKFTKDAVPLEMLLPSSERPKHMLRQARSGGHWEPTLFRGTSLFVKDGVVTDFVVQ